MRLIDADALIEVIQKYKFGAISNKSEREYTREIMLCFVNGSSTAYSVENVVEELEKIKSFYCDDDDWDKAKEDAFREAINIVRKGGVK